MRERERGNLCRRRPSDPFLFPLPILVIVPSFVNRPSTQPPPPPPSPLRRRLGARAPRLLGVVVYRLRSVAARDGGVRELTVATQGPPSANLNLQSAVDVVVPPARALRKRNYKEGPFYCALHHKERKKERKNGKEGREDRERRLRAVPSASRVHAAVSGRSSPTA